MGDQGVRQHGKHVEAEGVTETHHHAHRDPRSVIPLEPVVDRRLTDAELESQLPITQPGLPPPSLDRCIQRRPNSFFRPPVSGFM